MTTTMKVMLAIDGGGSRTRCRAITREGHTLGAGEGGASNHLLVALEVVRASLEEAINAALDQAQLKRTDVAGVSAGLAGVDYDGSGAAEMEELFREMSFARTVINGDMVIAHAGALGGGPGVLALAGTGSAILGIDAGGRRVKVGGWGPVYGDEGGAYRIAQQALRAAAKAFDGRGAETALLPVLTRALEIENFNETVRRVYVEKMESRAIAALCRVVCEVAESGDSVAQGIFQQAGDELAEGVATAVRRLGLSAVGTNISYQGSVLESYALARERFGESLRRQFPEISLVPPRFKPVIGAYLLGCEAMGRSPGEGVFSALEAVEKE